MNIQFCALPPDGALIAAFQHFLEKLIRHRSGLRAAQRAGRVHRFKQSNFRPSSLAFRDARSSRTTTLLAQYEIRLAQAARDAPVSFVPISSLFH